MLSRELRRIGIAISHHSLQKRSRVESWNFDESFVFPKNYSWWGGRKRGGKKKKKRIKQEKIILKTQTNIPHIISGNNISPTINNFIARIWDIFSVQTSVLLLHQNVAALRRGKGLIYICKVSHSIISGNFYRNWYNVAKFEETE